ncbi:MAG TPA: hypothetical protein VFM14_01740 [Gemmatimonadales bacterium]|nr:hypothetical protein [Gemmatimonadales bacterium]
MGKSVVLGIAGGVLGYLVAGFGGGLAISLLSPNTHDRSAEAALTGAFVLGPMGAVVGFLIAFLRSRTRGNGTKKQSIP